MVGAEYPTMVLRFRVSSIWNHSSPPRAGPFAGTRTVPMPIRSRIPEALHQTFRSIFHCCSGSSFVHLESLVTSPYQPVGAGTSTVPMPIRSRIPSPKQQILNARNVSIDSSLSVRVVVRPFGITRHLHVPARWGRNAYRADAY
jgi:hypothetical protein